MIEKIVIHCAATKPGHDADVDEVSVWHKRRGFKRKYKGKTYHIGYHWLIRLSGALEQGRPEEISGAHVRGHNKGSIGICMVGGLDKDGNPSPNYTPEQWVALQNLVRGLTVRYPNALVMGHRDLDAGKECPCFDAAAWWAEVDA